MVPWAGRVDHGRFGFQGRQHQLPIRIEPHSLHGTGMDQSWTVAATSTSDVQLDLDLSQPVGEFVWPYAGRVTQTVQVAEDHLTLTMALWADEAMPAMLGWHPWFRRQLTDDGPSAELAFSAQSMYALDETAIPTGELITPPPGPWDNCFTDLETDPVIEWPGQVRLRLSSTCSHWVVYTEPPAALCVEPQTDAPDSVNRDPQVIPAGGSMTAVFRIDIDQPPP